MTKRTQLSSPSLAAPMVLRIVEYAAKRGHEAGALCRSVGLSLATLREPNARLPYALAEQLCQRVVKLLREPNIGLQIAQDVRDPRHFDAGVLMLMASASVGVALERMVRYQRFWGDGERAALVPVRGGVCVRYRLPTPEGITQRHNDECALLEVVLGLSSLALSPVRPRVVRFRHRAPADLREHEALFGCPLEFAASHSEVVFDDVTLAVPMRHAHDFYGEIFRQQVERTIASLPRDETSADAVRALLRVALAGGACTLLAAARTLGTSARTLQRRLKAEETSFEALLDAERRDLALAYLDRGTPLRELAELLGYADDKAFQHAFKRWTGLSPERMRRQRARGAASA